MGMSFNPMYRPTSTTSITVDGDLDVNPYDVLGTDGKFDTVEADEFVGGVGNFSSGLVSGNLQLDGNLIIEGSINNVNIADNGEITTSQGVNGADFNGVPIKKTITVTSGSVVASSSGGPDYGAVIYLPPILGVVYTGSVKVTLSNTRYGYSLSGGALQGWTTGYSNGEKTISFTNAKSVLVLGEEPFTNCRPHTYTLS